MKNFQKRLAGLSLGLLMALGVGAANGQHDVVAAKAVQYLTFDLKTTTQITEATESSLVFTSGSQVLSIAKNNAKYAANSYCPPTYKKTIAYSGSNITIDAGPGYLITCATFIYQSSASSYSFVDLSGDIWTGATFKSKGTAYSDDSRQTISVLLTKNHDMTHVNLVYEENPNPSISLARIGELKIGDTGEISYTTTKATNPVVTFSSSNSDVLSIDDDGKYTCKAPGATTITANMTCAEGSASASVDVIVNTGLITIEEANQLGSQLSSGSISKYSVIVKGYITNLNPFDDRSGSESAITLSDKKSGESNANSLIIDGIYSRNELRDIAILNGQVTIKGKIGNFDGIPLLEDPEWSNFTIDGAVFADFFIDTLKGKDGACTDPNIDNTEALQTAWRVLGNKWPKVDSVSKETLKTATAEDANYGEFVKLYDHIMTRYGEAKLGEDANFVGRSISKTTPGAHNVLVSADNSLTITIIVLVSMLSVSLIVGTSLIVRKRKAN